MRSHNDLLLLRKLSSAPPLMLTELQVTDSLTLLSENLPSFLLNNSVLCDTCMALGGTA